VIGGRGGRRRARRERWLREARWLRAAAGVLDETDPFEKVTAARMREIADLIESEHS
jgi:hypothetical protein